MITITRSMARPVRAVFRKALGNAARGRFGSVALHANSEGLVFQARQHDVAVEYRVPGQHPAETLFITVDLLHDVEGTKDEPVQIQSCGKNPVEARWTDGSIPQGKHYDTGGADQVLKGFPLGFQNPTLPAAPVQRVGSVISAILVAKLTLPDLVPHQLPRVTRHPRGSTEPVHSRRAGRIRCQRELSALSTGTTGYHTSARTTSAETGPSDQRVAHVVWVNGPSRRDRIVMILGGSMVSSVNLHLRMLSRGRAA